MREQNEQNGAGEGQVEGFPHRLFDGYDGDAREPGEAEALEMLKNAPPEVRARAEVWAKERAALDAKDKGADGQAEGEQDNQQAAPAAE